MIRNRPTYLTRDEEAAAFEQALLSTHDGQADVAADKKHHCSDCRFYTGGSHKLQGQYRGFKTRGRCSLYRKFSGRAGAEFPSDAWACKHYEEDEKSRSARMRLISERDS